jgi:hypothetical protein
MKKCTEEPVLNGGMEATVRILETTPTPTGELELLGELVVDDNHEGRRKTRRSGPPRVPSFPPLYDATKKLRSININEGEFRFQLTFKFLYFFQIYACMYVQSVLYESSIRIVHMLITNNK